MSNNKDKVLYSAVVIDKESKDKLMNALASKLPEGWKVFAHHMTIVFGKGLEDKSEIDVNPESLREVSEIILDFCQLLA